ncbi:hypothetical protein GCM10023319_19910 [Nocardia iowensis]
MLSNYVAAVREGNARLARDGASRQDGNGWDLFFASRMMRSEMTSRLKMTCPANQRMREAKQRRVVEAIYDVVRAKKSTLHAAELLTATQKACQDAWERPEENFEHFYRKSRESNKNARGGRGLDL